MISENWLAAAALGVALLALIGLLIVWRGYRALREAQTARERWFQEQIEGLERECRGLESALAGFGRHLDEVDARLGRAAAQRKRKEGGAA
ncbi:MAG: hypothetical protein ACQER6_10270 [Pseudomonadota bacterium]